MPPCFCSPLHESCDPVRCEKAGPFEPGPERIPFPDIGKNGCKTCELIVQGVCLPAIKSLWDQPEWKDEPDGEQLKIGWAPGTKFVRTAANDNGYTWKHFEFSLAPDAPKSEICLGFPRKPKHLFPYTGSAESLRLLNLWVRTCDEKHACYSEETTTLPNRVLNINSDQIVVENGNEREALYTTLSHCWGERGPSAKLDKSTYDKLTTTGIEFSELPKTYQDAIHVTRQLEKNIKYIWIDSLCIVQDDLADWTSEAYRMLSVYGSSYLNICAKHAVDASFGCFVDVDVEETPHTSYPIPDSNVLIREVPRPTHHDHGVHHVDSQPNPQPLLKRGWVLQERLLAPRLVYFDRHELLWECNASRDCQCGALSTMIGFKDYWSSALAPGEMKHMNKEHPICAWMKILPKYTSMRLTHETDRLIALAGVAQKLQQRNVGEYIAGMWRSNLERQMTWYPEEIFTPAGGKRMAPSWSWASRQGRMEFCEAGNWNMDEEKWPAQDAQILSIENLPFSIEEPRSAALRVRSRVVVVQATAVMEGPPTYYSMKEKGKFIGYARGDFGGVELGTTQELVLLWWGWPWDGSASWLMLKKSTDQKGYYERFGLWPCSLIEQQSEAAEKLARGLSKKKRKEMTVDIL